MRRRARVHLRPLAVLLVIAAAVLQARPLWVLTQAGPAAPGKSIAALGLGLEDAVLPRKPGQAPDAGPRWEPIAGAPPRCIGPDSRADGPPASPASSADARRPHPRRSALCRWLI